MENYIFKKLNAEPVFIETVEDEHDPDRDFTPSFWFNNRRYYLDNFIRIHGTPWTCSGAEYPEYIHGIEADEYYRPLFVEILDGEAVNIYLETVQK